MQNFSRKGFQLRSASLETRIAYTGFLMLMLPAIGTVLALSVGRTGFNADAIALHYRGGADELHFPRDFWLMMETSHFHLFTIPVAVLVLSHLLVATPASQAIRVWVTLSMFAGAVIDAAGPWLVRYVAAGFAWLLLAGWMLLVFGGLAAVVLSLLAMWAPEKWLGFMVGKAPEKKEEAA